MATEHYCPDHPEEPGWQPGSSEGCSYHGMRLSNLTPVRMSGKERRKADKAAGTIGQDRGGYIHSPEGL